MKYLVFSIIFIVFCALNLYVFYSFQKIIPSKILKYIFLSLQIFSILAFLVSMLAKNFLPYCLNSFLYRIGTSFLIIFLYFLFFCVIKDLLSFIPILKSIFSKNYYTLITFCFLFLALFSLAYFNYRNKKRVEISINTEKISEPLKIIAISDMHLGYSISRAEFSNWVNLINSENPDALIIAGDIIDNSVDILFEKKYSEIFKKINTKYGIYAALGNHDNFAPLEKTMAFLKDCDINVLADTIVDFNTDVQIIGRCDRSNIKRKDLSLICKNLDKNKFSILLDHQPSDLQACEKNNIDFQFSGHTHGGQIFPINFITNMLFEKHYGQIEKGNSIIYVSSGIGIWGGKFRLGSRSEYIVLNLNPIKK